MVSLTSRLVRTSTRRTDSNNSVIVMTPMDQNPKPETRNPKEIRRPKSESELRKSGLTAENATNAK